MAKPCVYRLPGTDTWLSEADFKKTLNDGLLDKHINDGVISIRNFKAKEEATPVAETPKVEEVKAEAPVTEEATKSEVTLSPKAEGMKNWFLDYYNSVPARNTKQRSSKYQYIASKQSSLDPEEREAAKAAMAEISNSEKTTKESKPALSKKDQEELNQVEKDIEYTANKIQNFEEELEIEKDNYREEKERIAQEKAKVRASKMPKDQKAERLEELDAELSDIKNDHDDLVKIYKDDIAAEKSDFKRYNNRKAKIQAKANTTQETKSEPVTEKPAEAKEEAPKKESVYNKNGSFTDKYGINLTKKLIESSGPRRMSMLAKGLRKAGFSIGYSFEEKTTLSQILIDSIDHISYEYELLSDEEKIEATKILTNLANKLGVEVEANTETKAEPVKTEKAPKAEAKESYKAKAMDKRGGDKAYTVTVNGDTADVVGEQRPSPMDPTKMTPGASYKALPIKTNINGQRVVETPTGDTIYLDKPIAEKVEEVAETKERVSEGKGANITVDVPGRSVSSPVVKMVKNRRTNQWQALKPDGTTYEPSDIIKEKAEGIYQQTRTDAKVVNLPSLEANGRTRKMVFSNTTNKWMEVAEDGTLFNITESSAKAAEKAYNSKKEDIKRKISEGFDKFKADTKGKLYAIPFSPAIWNKIVELTKQLVLKGVDFTFAINEAAKTVTDELLKKNEIAEKEAQDIINYISSDEFRMRPEYSGIKNALSSDAARELSEEKIQRMSYKQALDLGKEAVDSGEINPSEIINQIINVKGRSLDPIETVAMSYYKVGLDNQLADLYDRLSKETNEDSRDLLLAEIDAIEQKIADYDVMANITGYFNGLSLALRRVMLNSQYDAVMMVNKVRAKYGDKAMPEGLEDKLRDASKKINELNKEIERLKNESKEKSDSEAVQDIKEDNARRKGKKKNKAEEKTYVSSKDGKISVSTELIREAVEQGAETIEDVINYVKADVQAMFPDASDRQIRDAISNYGKQVNPTKDEIQKKINEIKSIGRMLSKLEDIQKALANNSLFDNLKSKKARRDARRRLSEQEEQLKIAIREEMAKLPLSIEDIEFMNEQRLESYKKRKQNEIAELDKKILQNDLSRKSKQSTILDKEAQELKEKRDALNAQLEELRKQQPLTDEQIEERRAKRLEQYKKRLADRNKDLQRRIAEKDFSKRAKPESIKKDEEARQLEIERQKLIHDYEYELEKAEMAASPWWEKAKMGLSSVTNLPKGLLASIDVSAPLRQGIVMMLTQNPIKSGKQIVQMFSFWANPDKYDKWLDKLKSSEYYPLLKESGLFIAEQSGKLSAMEEMLANNLGNKIPILGQSYKIKGRTVIPGTNLYKRSEYAYSGFLNNLRVETFLDGAKALKEMGLTPEANKDEFKSWASYVNNATGRGTMDASIALKLGSVFFSPRLIKSRINIGMNPFYYLNLSPAARKMAAKRTGTFFAMATTIVGLAALYYNNDDDDDTSVELDPRSSDFGKIKIKNTRVDFLGGFLPFYRSVSQFTMGQKKSLTSGQIEELNQKFGGTSRKDIVMDFFANKLAPIPRAIYDWADKSASEKERDKLEKEQDNSIWNDLGYPVWAQNLTVPIWTQDVKRLNEEHGVVAGTGLTMLNLIGAGVQNFKPKHKKPSGGSTSLDDIYEFDEIDDIDNIDQIDNIENIQ